MNYYIQQMYNKVYYSIHYLQDLMSRSLNIPKSSKGHSQEPIQKRTDSFVFTVVVGLLDIFLRIPHIYGARPQRNMVNCLSCLSIFRRILMSDLRFQYDSLLHKILTEFLLASEHGQAIFFRDNTIHVDAYSSALHGLMPVYLRFCPLCYSILVAHE